MDKNKIKINDRYGKLTVLKKHRETDKCTYWECLCDCGNKRVFSENNLITGHNKSCGQRRKINRYRICETYVEIYLDNKGIFIIDIEDYNKISSYKWRESDEGYIFTFIKNKKHFVHRIIMGLRSFDVDKITVDHINHDKKDNRKQNLRPANKMENKRNGALRKDNQTGIIGVGIYKKYNKYVSFIAVKGVDKNLGYYENFQDAIIARLKAEKEHFKEFAPQRHLFKQYGIEK